jgi:collagenase-like PrtC family protease
MRNNKIVEFALGYNFDPELIDRVSELNSKFKNNGVINDFFAALPDSPYLSTRPNYRIPPVTWKDFISQIKAMQEYKIKFSYLLNAKSTIGDINTLKLSEFIKRLYDSGISEFIVYSPELCDLIKTMNDKLIITISSIFNIRTVEQIDLAYKAGANFICLDSIFINRDFKTLKKLQNYSKVPLKVYANVSCLSHCINKDQHYTALSNSDYNYQLKMNDRFFNYCSKEKLNKPVKWLQMQWIRPEDIHVYVEEGFKHFKLTDRLAPTKNLLLIAESYLKGQSPQDLFPLMERNGTKYRAYKAYNDGKQPFLIDNSKIPIDFIEHFRSGNCLSTDENCDYCNKIENEAIKVNSAF